MKHFQPKEAYDFLEHNPDAVLVDCRSEIEFLFVGHPSGAHHVAWNDGDVINELEGFEGPLDLHHQRSKIYGWRKDGLPWEQT